MSEKYTLCGSFIISQKEKTSFLPIFKCNNRFFILENNSIIIPVNFNSYNDYLKFVFEKSNLLTNVEYFVSRKKIELDNIENFSIKNWQNSKPIKVNDKDVLFNYINNNKESILQNNISGFLKYISFNKENNSYNLYIDCEKSFYKINITFTKGRDFNSIKNLSFTTSFVSADKFNKDEEYFIPKTVDDINIKIDNLNGIYSKRKLAINNLLLVTNSSFCFFKENAMKVDFKEVLNTLDMRQEIFGEFVDELVKSRNEDILMFDDFIKTLETYEGDTYDSEIEEPMDLEPINIKNTGYRDFLPSDR